MFTAETRHASHRTCAFALLVVSIVAQPLAASTAEAQSSSPCAGDCNGDGVVTVDELIRGVNIALGTLAVSVCPAFDTNGDGQVTVDEIVAAVVTALRGCPVDPTATPTPVVTLAPPTSTATLEVTAAPATSTATTTTTHTATASFTASPSSTPTSTTTPTPSPGVFEPIRVLISTGDFIGVPGRMLTSLSAPVLSPAGVVLAVGVVGDNTEDFREVLLRLDATSEARVVLEQGQSTDAGQVASIGQPNGKLAGSFVLVDTDVGASILRRGDEGDFEAVLGVGAPGNRADFEPREYVVSPTDGSVLADVFAPGFKRALVAAPAQIGAPAAAIVTVGDAQSYRNADGEVIDGVVTDIRTDGPVAATDEGGSGNLVVDDSVGMFLAFSIDAEKTVSRRAALVEGNPAPGFEAEITLLRFDRGPFTGGAGDFDTRGFVTFLAGPGIDATNQAAAIITDTSYEAIVVVQEGDVLADVPGAIVGSIDAPVMGADGAAVRFLQEGPDDSSHEVIGYADYERKTFTVVVASGDQAPGGGVFMGLPRALAINAGGQLIFRGDLGDGDSGYYAVSVAAAGATPRRLVGTGDIVTLANGGSAMITALGSIEPTSGLGGEPSAINATHFALAATLDAMEEAILLVDVGE